MTAIPLPPTSDADGGWKGQHSVGRQWWLAVVLTILALLSSVDRHVISLLVGDIQATLHLGDTQISLLLGLAFALAYTIASIPAGYLADRFPRRAVVGGAVLVWSTMTVFCGMSSMYWQLFAARAGVGIGEGSLIPATVSLVRDGVDPVRRGRAFALVTAGPLAGTGLAMLTGGLLIALIERYGAALPLVGHLPPWQLALGAVGVLGMPLVLLVLTIYEPERTDRARRDGLLAGYGAALRHVRANRRIFWPLLILSVFNGLIGAAFGAWVPSILRRSYHLTSAQIALGFGSLMVVAVPCGLFVAGILIDRLRRRSSSVGAPLAAIIGAAAVGSAATLVPLMPNLMLLWPVFAVQLLMSGVPVAAVQIIIADNTPSHLVGKVAAINVLALGVIGQSTGPTIAAFAGSALFRGPHALAFGLSLTSALAVSIAVAAGVFLVRAARSRSAGS